MNIFVHLRVVRMMLGAAVTIRTLAWGAAAGLTLIAGSALIDLVTPLPIALRSNLLELAVATSLLVAVVVAWQNRTIMTLERVALWIEESFPALEYALVTAVATGRDDLVAAANPAQWTSMARVRAVRAVVAPLGLVVAVAVVIVLLPRGTLDRVRSPHAGDSLERAGARSAPGGNRLVPLVGRVVPPRYTREPATAIDEPSDVRAPSGSTLILAGRGDGAGIIARISADSTFAARARGDWWEIAIRIGSRPIAIELLDRRYRRVIAVEPVSDSAPNVTLLAPAHDTVLRTLRGRIVLAAIARDDYEVAAASFEYIVSSGSGETFTFRSGTLGRIEPRTRRVSFNGSLSLDLLALKPGDIVHVRAVARNANDVSRPGVGVSDTRSLRVARSGEYDPVVVEGVAPSEADRGAISERMLIQAVEALERNRPTKSAVAVISESRAIAVDQQKLRRTVGEFVYTRLGGDPTGEEHSDDGSPARARTMERMLAHADSATNRSTGPIDFGGGESPVIAVSKPLLDAYNAMWEAATALELGEPAHALPPMHRALVAIESARRAERVYLRGSAPSVVVDIGRVRLKGKDTGASSGRRAAILLDSASRQRMERFARIVELSARDPLAAADSLLIFRIEVLAQHPGFAAATSIAASAMRRGETDVAVMALRRARRALGGSPLIRDSLSRWGVGGIAP